MERIAEAARNLPDARVQYLIQWIRERMCAGAHLPNDLAFERNAPWSDIRLLIFTEYEDTRRWLASLLQNAIRGTQAWEQRIEVFSGATSRERRRAIQHAFNLPPDEHPLRILIATDAAREGLNLQAQCYNLFHFDVPWNPSRLEQRNGRIDRKLQPHPEVFCHYFVYTQRPEDRVLRTLVRKTGTIRSELGSLYFARRRLIWPGEASVVVSVVHVMRGNSNLPVYLDGMPVERISAYLLDGHTDTRPFALNDHCKRIVGGYGNVPGTLRFVVDDNVDEADLRLQIETLIETEPFYSNIFKRYLGGFDLNNEATPLLKRWIFDFGGMSAEEVLKYPRAIELLRTRIQPKEGQDNWWQFARRAQELRVAIDRHCNHRVLVVADASDALAFTFVPKNWCLSKSIVAFATDRFSVFAVLQSRTHDVWVRTLSLSLKDDLRYVPGDCWDTFPLPLEAETYSTLEHLGKKYFNFRVDIMMRNNEGLTKTYNRFHDPDERNMDTLALRELHAEMDRIVLDAYGWTDISTKCGFFLEYEDEEEEEADGRARKRKKPWWYRWPDDVRDEVLARLLELNAQRAEEERLLGLAAAAKTGGKKAGGKKASGKRGAGTLEMEGFEPRP